VGSFEPYQDIDLTTQYILSLLERVCCGSRRSGNDLVEARGEVSGRILCFRSDRMEIGGGPILSIR